MTIKAQKSVLLKLKDAKDRAVKEITARSERDLDELRRVHSADSDAIFQKHKMEISILNAKHIDETSNLKRECDIRDEKIETLEEQLHEMKRRFTDSQMEMLKTNWGMK